MEINLKKWQQKAKTSAQRRHNLESKGKITLWEDSTKNFKGPREGGWRRGRRVFGKTTRRAGARVVFLQMPFQTTLMTVPVSHLSLSCIKGVVKDMRGMVSSSGLPHVLGPSQYHRRVTPGLPGTQNYGKVL